MGILNGKVEWGTIQDPCSRSPFKTIQISGQWQLYTCTGSFILLFKECHDITLFCACLTSRFHNIILLFIFRFAESLDHKNPDGTAWEASCGFLRQFFKRSRRVYGKRNDCPDFGNWIENVLEPLLQQYETWDIYNADETSLFFKSLSDRTMSFDGEQPTGSKLTSSKDHLSLMLCANMTGTDK